MPRPVSPEKRVASLRAAVETVAEEGTSAPTSRIAKRAGIAEGTLFTYFPNKDELLNAVYLELKSDLAEAMDGEDSEGGSLERARHFWVNYIAWGAADPQKYKALRQLAVSERITEESRELGRRCLAFIRDVFDQKSNGKLKADTEFNVALMSAIADVTLEYVARHPRKLKQYTQLGFEAFWRAMGRSLGEAVSRSEK